MPRLPSLRFATIALFAPLALTLMTPSQPHAQTKAKTHTAIKTFACSNTAALWRIEHGEARYAKAFCEAGCSGYSENEGGFTKGELKACVKGVKEVTKTFYDGRCMDIKHDIQLIRAWHGQAFDGPNWKAHFKKHYKWYGKRAKIPYSAAAIKLRVELEKRRARCPKMSADQKRYASTLIAALKRGRVSGKTPLASIGEEEVNVLTGKDRDAVLVGYDRMESYAPAVLSRPTLLVKKERFDDPDDTRPALPKMLKGLTYKATIEIGGSRMSPYCDHFNGDEECGSGGVYTTYYFNKKATIIASSNYGEACPFVYTRDAKQAWSYQGEILRNLRRPSLEGPQTLAVHVTQQECDTGVLHIKLTEEKQETTWLDAVSVQVGAHRIAPTRCTRDASDALCTDDARYRKLEQGDEVELLFALPHDARTACSAGDVRVHADGYYIPTLTSTTQATSR